MAGLVTLWDNTGSCINKSKKMPIIAIAPMLDWTDRHFRYFMRQITTSTVLFTEMIVDNAILHGNQEKLLGFDNSEHPVIIQLGGSDPEKLSQAATGCEKFGYKGINLNVGCPSDRVKSGNFGACLMQDAKLVAKCIKSMQDSVSIPVTVKHRIGLNYDNDYNFVYNFVYELSTIGCNHFVVHARNAVLSGLSPKQNREIPVLRYDYVYRLKQDFPELEFIINGGIKTIEDINEHLKYVDGVMLGREAYYNPYLFANFDKIWYNSQSIVKSRIEIAKSMIPYMKEAAKNDIYLHHITRHMIGLYHGCKNAKIWRYQLTNEMIKTNSMDTYNKLLDFMEDIE